MTESRPLGAHFYEEVEWAPTPVDAKRHDGAGTIRPLDATRGRGPMLVPGHFYVYVDGRKVRRSKVYRLLTDCYVGGAGGPATGGVTKGVTLPAGTYIKCTNHGDEHTLAIIRYW